MLSLPRIAACVVIMLSAAQASAQQFRCPPGECQPNANTVPPNDSVLGLRGGAPQNGPAPTEISPREREQDRIAHSICADPAC